MPQQSLLSFFAKPSSKLSTQSANIRSEDKDDTKKRKAQATPSNMPTAKVQRVVHVREETHSKKGSSSNWIYACKDVNGVMYKTDGWDGQTLVIPKHLCEEFTASKAAQPQPLTVFNLTQLSTLLNK